MLGEWIFDLICKKDNTITDLSAVVTGLLLALNLPPRAPWWIGVIGGLFAIIVVKMLFGGLGQNFIKKNSNRCFTYFFLLLNITVHSARTFVESCRISL